jgi:hypothetical protein
VLPHVSEEGDTSEINIARILGLHAIFGGIPTYIMFIDLIVYIETLAPEPTLSILLTGLQQRLTGGHLSCFLLG